MIDLQNSYFVILMAGIALFLYGMNVASQSLEKLMADKISALMHKLSHSQFLAIVVGISMTTLLQSSGAVTSMLVTLGSAKVISLGQVMGVIIGTAIGSTLTVQLVSLNLTQFALPLFTIAFFVYFATKKPKVRHITLILMGFSLLFVGLGMMSSATAHYAALPEFQKYLQVFKDNPTAYLFISLVICAVFHSSTATIVLAMTLAQSGSISVSDALMWVYGANIGTTSTALMAAIGSNYIGKQVAWAHFFYKTASVVVFYFTPLNDILVKFTTSFDTTISRSVANGHLIFNIASAVLFYPFIKQGAKWIERMFPKHIDEDFQAAYLTLNNYQSTALATSFANREILRTADIVLTMISDSIKLFETSDPALFESIKERDNKVDFLYRETKMFLLDHANKTQSGVHNNVMKLIMFVSDLERAADIIDLNIATLAAKKHALKLEFSEEGWRELKEMHMRVFHLSTMAVNAFNNKSMCEEAIQMKRELAKIEIHFREHHIARLNQGLQESINTSSIHLDLLSEYKRIASLLVNHAYNSAQNQIS